MTVETSIAQKLFLCDCQRTAFSLAITKRQNVFYSPLLSSLKLNILGCFSQRSTAKEDHFLLLRIQIRFRQDTDQLLSYRVLGLVTAGFF